MGQAAASKTTQKKVSKAQAEVFISELLSANERVDQISQQDYGA
jgi:hypothetical protein